MAKPKLTYFDFPGGRGEDSRIALHIAGVDFEDDRVKFADWAALKPSTPFGSIPVLTIEGKGQLAQSNTILRFIGANHGLHPSDPWLAGQHDAPGRQQLPRRRRPAPAPGARAQGVQCPRRRPPLGLDLDPARPRPLPAVSAAA